MRISTRLVGGLALAMWLNVVAGWGVRAAAASGLRGNLAIHDPSTILQCKDRYYIFGTGRGIVSKWSADKVVWNAGPPVFAKAPAWTTNTVPGFDGIIWAPEIIFLNGEYRLYYAVSTWASQVSAIGLATNPTLDPADPNYLWTDRGIVIQSYERSAYNTIDPSVTLDAAGNPWLGFGSYWNGLYVVQLERQTGLRLSPGSPTYRVAYNSSIEATCLFRRGPYYYLFANWGSCCSGVNSTYNIRVGRSTRVTGPYLDRNGIDLAANGGTLFLEGTGKFTGPGHVGILSEGGAQWFSYHYYDAGAWAPNYSAFGEADLDLQPLAWTADDWPVFTNDWAAVYDFETDARDEGGQYYGALAGGASIQRDPVLGRVLNLSGTNQYVQLPAGVANARTFVAVVKWNGGPAWQRLLDLGTESTRYLLLTPSSANGKVRCDLRADGVIQTLEGPNALPVGAWSQVALTLDGRRGVLYVKGSPVATNSSMSISPLDIQAQTNYLGHSLFSSNPDFNGQIASFRAYGRVLSPAELVAPLPVITQPQDGTRYWPGSTIAFSGRGTDFARAPLPLGSQSWRIDYLLDGRTNLVFGPVTGIDNGVFTIPANGTGGGIYRITLTASGGFGRQRAVTATLHPANPPPAWSSYYPLTEDAADAHGHFDGTLQNGASIQVDPERGAALNLNGTNQYVRVPAGLGALRTFMAWVKWRGGGAGQRVFEFGNGTNRYARLTPAGPTGKLQLSLALNASVGETTLVAPDPLPVNLWTHVAVTMDGHSAILYTNGTPIGTNANFDLVPANLGATNFYLGGGQGTEPYFNGLLSAVRGDARVLTASEIVAPQPVVVQPAHGALYAPGDVIHFAGGARDFFDQAIELAGLAWTVQFRNGANVVPLYDGVSGLTEGTFAVPSAGLAATNGYYRIALVATDSLGRKATNEVAVFPAGMAVVGGSWEAFYPFTAGAADAWHRLNGSLAGGASVQADAERGPVLKLSGTGQYVGLPAGVGSLQTFSAWVNWNGGSAWQRLFDFGQGTSRWLMLTPRDGDGRMECALSTDRSNYVQVIQSVSALPTGVWTHVAITLDGRQGILYTNGVMAGLNHSVNLLPADVGATQCYLGRSQYPADAYFTGQIDSVRMSSRALSLGELLAPEAATATLELGVTSESNEVLLSWPSWATTLLLYTGTDPAFTADWGSVTNVPILAKGRWHLGLPAWDKRRFYQLRWP